MSGTLISRHRKMANLPITIKCGDTFRRVLVMRKVIGIDAAGERITEPLDLTGWGVRAQVRATKESNAILASFTATLQDAGAGKVLLVIAAGTTATLAPSGARPPVWDLEFTKSDGDIWTPVGGDVTIDGDVTRT